MRAPRILLRVILAIVVVVLVGAGLAWLALSNELVTRRLIRLGLAQAGSQVAVGQIEGTVRGPLVLRNISLRNEGLRATVDSVRFEWSPAGLLHRELRIDRLHADGIHVQLPDSTPPKRDTLPPSRPRLPIAVVFGDVSARGISVDAPGGVTLRQGSIRLAGRSSAYTVHVQGDAATPAIKSAHLEADGQGNLEQLTALRATANLLDGRIAVAGPVSWWPKIGWNLSVRGDSIRPGAAMERPATLPGTIALRATTAGTMDSTGPAGRLSLDSLGGTLRKQPLRGQARVRFADSVYRLDTLALAWGSARLDARGRAGDSVDLRYRLSAANLATVLPGASGSVSAWGTAIGPRTTPRIRVETRGDRIRMGKNRLGHLAGRADVDLAADGRTDADLEIDRARLGAQPVQRIALALRGTRPDHRANLSLVAPNLQVELGVSGGAKGRRWKGQIASARISGAELRGDWLLERPAELKVSGDTASLGQLCLQNQNDHAARLCAEGAWEKTNGWRASADVERLPLALADSLLPVGDSLRGTLEARLKAAAGRSGRLDARLELSARQAVLHYADASGHGPRVIALDTAGVELQAGAKGVHGALVLRASDGKHGGIGNVAAQVALPEYRRLGSPLEHQPFTATVNGGITNLAFVRTFTTQLDSIGGGVDLKLEAGGTVHAPRLDAHVAPRGFWVAYPPDSTRQRYTLSGRGIEAHAGPDGARATADLAVADATGVQLGTVAGRVELPKYTSFDRPIRNQPLAARLSARISDLAVARGLASGVDTLHGNATLEVGATGTAGTPRVQGRLRIENLMARLPHGARLTGAVAGDARGAVGRDSSLQADLSLIPHNVVIVYAPDSVPRRLTLDSTGLVIRAGRDGVHGALDLRMRESGGRQLAALSSQVALPRYTKLGAPIPPQPVAARLTGSVDDLSIAQAFSTELDSVSGRIGLDARLSGTAGKPQVVGGLRMQGAANIPRLGLRIRDLALSADGDQAGRIRIDGRLRSGRGTLALEGRSPVRPTPADPGQLHIQGDSVEAANTGEARVLVSPRIDVALTGDSVDVQGTVRVPYARVELSELPQTAVPPTDDVVFTDTVASKGAPQRIAARVRVVFGDSVSFKGFNFDANLGGDLFAVAQPNRPTTGSGAIIIRKGQYKAYGQDLSITDGTIRFAGGPVDNPGLDIRATRTAEDTVTAGVQIRGTLKAPEVTIFSNPPMDQGRALQYLVLGHPLGESSGAQGSLASKAASSVGLRGGNLLANTVGKGIGLDVAKVETKGDLSQASFVAGKYLSPNVYVSYGIGLFDPVSTLRLRYVLSSKWTLQAEKGAATGADLLYRFEAGR